MRGGRRDRPRARRRLRRGRRPAGHRRPQGRRARRRRRRRRPAARADRLRGQERVRAEEQGARGARRRDGAARRRLRRLGRARPRTCSPATARSCARSTATSCSSSSTPRTARVGLEVAYALARARTLMAKADGEGLDAGALRAEVERALAAMDDVRRIKSQLTAATNGIDAARKILDDMAERVRGHLVAGGRARRRRDGRRHAAPGPAGLAPSGASVGNSSTPRKSRRMPDAVV